MKWKEMFIDWDLETERDREMDNLSLKESKETTVSHKGSTNCLISSAGHIFQSLNHQVDTLGQLE